MLIWYIALNTEINLLIIRLVNYSVTTSLIYRYILWEMLGVFSGIALIVLSGGFSVEMLTEV